ncbi:3389_t:CDS:1, partial [Acaulospora morrowiae]
SKIQYNAVRCHLKISFDWKIGRSLAFVYKCKILGVTSQFNNEHKLLPGLLGNPAGVKNGSFILYSY